MALEPKGTNIDKSFTVSGVKYIGDYIYVLLIDLAGTVIIKRIKTDDSELKYHCKQDAESIEAFWVDPEAHEATGDTGYTWIHRC